MHLISIDALDVLDRVTGAVRSFAAGGFPPRQAAAVVVMKDADGLPYAGEEQARFAVSPDVLELSPFYEHECRHGA